MTLITVPKSDYSSKSEGLTFTLNYLRSPDLSIEEKVQEGQKALAMIQQRLEIIEDERGITHFALGGLVHAIKEDDLWRRLAGDKYEDSWKWGDFCREILHMGASKANRLEHIWERSQKVKMSVDEIENLGWPASHKILQVAENRQDVDKWMNRFEDADTKHEVMEELEEVRRARHGGSGKSEEDLDAEEERVRYNRELQFSKDQCIFFDQVIETAAGRLGKILGVSTSTRDCLLFILASWQESLGGK